MRNENQFTLFWSYKSRVIYSGPRSKEYAYRDDNGVVGSSTNQKTIKKSCQQHGLDVT
jgi:hypothetical protein